MRMSDSVRRYCYVFPARSSLTLEGFRAGQRRSVSLSGRPRPVPGRRIAAGSRPVGPAPIWPAVGEAHGVGSAAGHSDGAGRRSAGGSPSPARRPHSRIGRGFSDMVIQDQGEVSSPLQLGKQRGDSAGKIGEDENLPLLLVDPLQHCWVRLLQTEAPDFVPLPFEGAGEDGARSKPIGVIVVKELNAPFPASSRLPEWHVASRQSRRSA